MFVKINKVQINESFNSARGTAMIMKYGTACTASLAATLLATTALAGNIGSDFDITMTPAAGGMAGVGIVRPQDPVASVFGNPATLTQLEGETSFTIGGTYLDVTAKADHDGLSCTASTRTLSLAAVSP
jgi:long-chain fatty acid transport protein